MSTDSEQPFELDELLQQSDQSSRHDSKGDVTQLEGDASEAESGPALLRCAITHLARTGTSSALTEGRKALVAFRQQGQLFGQIDALLLIAHLHIQRKEPELASRALGDASLMLKDEISKKSPRVAFLTSLLAKVHLLKGEFIAARRCAQDATAKYLEVGRPADASLMQHIVARACSGLEQHAAAVAAAQDALSTVAQLGDIRQQAQTHQLLAEVHLKAMDAEASVKAGQEARHLFSELKDRRSEAVVLHSTISAELMRKNVDGALRTAFDMLHLFDVTEEGGEQLPEEKLNRAAALYEVADVYLFRKEPHNALNPALSARKLYYELGDSSREVILTETLIKVHTMAGNPREAISCIYELVSIYQRAQKRPEEAATWLSLAKIHAERLMPQKAARAAEQALAVFQGLEDERGARDALQILAELEEVRDKLRFALMPAKDAMNHFQQTGDSSLLFQGALMAFEGRRDLALAQLDMFASGLGRIEGDPSSLANR